MVAATRMAVDLGICAPRLEQRLRRLLQRFGLPVTIRGVAPSAVWEAMAADKKRRNGRLRFVLPQRIGEVVISDQVPVEVALRAIAEVVKNDS
jgi:3-dehydroquinate synthase